MIIWLASYPRSGNTYFRILFKHFYGVRIPSLYQDKELARQNTSKKPIQYTPISQRLAAMKESPVPYIVKTHELPEDNFPAIYLVRDGRDALVSYAQFMLDVENINVDFKSLLHDLIVKPDFFGGWGTHVMNWTQRQAPTAIIKFEDLVKTSNPLSLLEQALNTVSYKLPEIITTDAPPTFIELHRKYPHIFHKGQLGHWRTKMLPELHDLFWKEYDGVMRKMGYRPTIWMQFKRLLC